VPKSRVRKKKVYTPPAELRPQSTLAARRRPSPVWLPVTAVSLIVFGILWLVMFYLTKDFTEPMITPLAKLNFWNLGIGFGGMVGALLLLSKWR